MYEFEIEADWISFSFLICMKVCHKMNSRTFLFKFVHVNWLDICKPEAIYKYSPLLNLASSTLAYASV